MAPAIRSDSSVSIAAASTSGSPWELRTSGNHPSAWQWASICSTSLAKNVSARSGTMSPMIFGRRRLRLTANKLGRYSCCASVFSICSRVDFRTLPGSLK